MMARILLAVGAAGAVAFALTVYMRDPEEPFAVATAVASLAIAAGAMGAAAALWLAAGRTTRGRRTRGGSRRGALRRGAELGGAVGLLALLRAMDGLTPVTGAFIVLAFVIAEAVVSARTA